MRRRFGGPQRKPELAAWPDEVEALTRRIALMEVEATFVVCDPLRAAKLRQTARLLGRRLELMKRLTLAAETAA